LDGEDFILQEQGVFTHSARGLCWRQVVAVRGDFSISCAAAEVTMDGGSNRSTVAVATARNEKP
jgi:hypothetical protein